MGVSVFPRTDLSRICGRVAGSRAQGQVLEYYSLGLGQKARLGEPLESKGKTEGKKHFTKENVEHNFFLSHGLQVITLTVKLTMSCTVKL